jgi:23S rRNA (guanosine2251-2'-O)-methyltransferase
VAAKASAYPTVNFDELLKKIKNKGNSAFILILGHIQDPQNLGSILRTAEAIGVHGAILPSDRAATVTPAAVRASAGAAEWIPVSVVPNLVRCMKTLQQEEFWLTGLEALPEAKGPGEIDFSGSVGLVIGSEGSGMGRLVRETCDFLLKLPITGNVTSYNASTAGAMAMYEVIRQRSLQS